MVQMLSSGYQLLTQTGRARNGHYRRRLNQSEVTRRTCQIVRRFGRIVLTAFCGPSLPSRPALPQGDPVVGKERPFRARGAGICQTWDALPYRPIPPSTSHRGTGRPF